MFLSNQYLWVLYSAFSFTALAWIFDSASFKNRLFRNISVALLTLLLALLVYMDFTATLTFAVLGLTLIVVLDFFLGKYKKKEDGQTALIVVQAKSLFLVLLIVWGIRSFIFQPYRVPTGSLQPTVQPGDFLVVNQFAYGLHFPLFNLKFFHVSEPKHGDLALFYHPKVPNMILVKRVIGLPGDKLVYRNKVLYINGKEMKQTEIGDTIASEPAFQNIPERHLPVIEKKENLDGVKHNIYVSAMPSFNVDAFSIEIPKSHYFMMGDNRDNSGDSRIWGPVPESLLIGKPMMVFLSWDSINSNIRFDRFGHWLNQVE